MNQNLADQKKTRSRNFVIGRIDLAHHSHVPWRCIAAAISLAPRLKYWHSCVEVMSLMGEVRCHKNRQ